MVSLTMKIFKAQLSYKMGAALVIFSLNLPRFLFQFLFSELLSRSEPFNFLEFECAQIHQFQLESAPQRNSERYFPAQMINRPKLT